MKFYCLRRARMAKTEVLERILERKISDGQWINDREKGLAYLKSLRDEYQRGKPAEVILRSHPEISIRYRADIKMHEVCVEA